MIDAHHHLWRYSQDQYPWIDEGKLLLRSNFLPEDLEKELEDTEINGTIAVQARQTLQETDWLLTLAEESKLLRGVVGWAPIAMERFQKDLDRLRSHKKLKGLRHVIQDEPDDDFINGADFNRGIAALQNTGLVYDILIYEKHLPAAARFVDRHPNQVFVLDHIAKPRIRDGILEPWATNITDLARRPNVYCKLSGMVSEANLTGWTVQDLQPYADVVLNAFTPARLMFGSDWPVCLLASTYRNWFESFNGLITKLSDTEKAQILGKNAINVYRLYE